MSGIRISRPNDKYDQKQFARIIEEIEKRLNQMTSGGTSTGVRIPRAGAAPVNGGSVEVGTLGGSSGLAPGYEPPPIKNSGPFGGPPARVMTGMTFAYLYGDQIQEAIDALGDYGGVVHLRAITYELAETVDVPSNVTIEGAGWDTIVYAPSGDGTYAFSMGKGLEGSRDKTSNISNAVIRNLTIKGRVDTEFFHEHTHLVNINGASDVLIENVQFKNWRGDAIYLGSSNVGHIKYTSTGSGQTLTTATAHNLEDGAEVVVWSTNATRGISSDIVMVDSSETVPTGLASKTAYYVVNKTSTTFELEASVGGGAITLSGTGTASVGNAGNYVGPERHNERITIRNCFFDGGATDKYQTTRAASVNATAATNDYVTITGHGIGRGKAVKFKTNPPGTMPAGLTAGQNYFIRDVGTNEFKLSDTLGGAVVDITSTGSNLQLDHETINNRQSISVIDCAVLKIYGNTFTNGGSATNPGAIDIEPDRAPYHIVDDISITDNTITDYGGNLGGIACALQYWGDFYQEPRNIKIRGNVIRNIPPAGIIVLRSNEAMTTDEPMEVTISDNHVSDATGVSTGQTGRGFSLFGVMGATVTGNYFKNCAGACTIGQNDTLSGDEECIDIIVSNNSFWQCGSVPYASDTDTYDNIINAGLAIGYAERLLVYGNIFYNCGDEDGGVEGQCIEFIGILGPESIFGNHFVSEGRTTMSIKNSAANTYGNWSFATTDVDTTDDEITITDHGYKTGDPVIISSAGTLPAGIEPYTVYYVKVVDDNIFTVSASPGGADLDITDVGSGTHAIRPHARHMYGLNVNRGLDAGGDHETHPSITNPHFEPRRDAAASAYWTDGNFETFNGVLRIEGQQVVGAQESAVSSPSGGGTVDSEARTAIDAIRTVLANHGLTA